MPPNPTPTPATKTAPKTPAEGLLPALQSVHTNALFLRPSCSPGWLGDSAIVSPLF